MQGVEKNRKNGVGDMAARTSPEQLLEKAYVLKDGYFSAK